MDAALAIVVRSLLALALALHGLPMQVAAAPDASQAEHSMPCHGGEGSGDDGQGEDDCCDDCGYPCSANAPAAVAAHAAPPRALVPDPFTSPAPFATLLFASSPPQRPPIH